MQFTGHTWTKLILASVLISWPALGAANSDPGEGGGDGNEIGTVSEIVRSGGGSYVNQLTGQPSQNVTVLGLSTKSGFGLTVDFHYGGYIKYQINGDNRQAPAGWLGAGWHCGFSSIYVVHNGTATSADDKYYYRYSSGAVSQIVQTDDGRYRVKADPYWYVEPAWAPCEQGQVPFIYGWSVTKPDGSIFRYGDFLVTPYTNRYNASRILPCVNNVIAGEESGSLRHFYYQWDLAEASDVNGSTISFTYDPQVVTPALGWPYTTESHVREVRALDTGDKLAFHTEQKSANEGPPSDKQLKYDIETEMRFLRKIEYRNAAEMLLSQVDLSYTGDPGEPAHMDDGVAGRQKRLLTQIRCWPRYRSSSRAFVYNRAGNYEVDSWPGKVGHYVGYLSSVHFPESGAEIAYDYTLRSMNFLDASGLERHVGCPVVYKLYQYGGRPEIPIDVTEYSYTIDRIRQLYLPETGAWYFGRVTAHTATGSVETTYDIMRANHAFGTPRLKVTYAQDGREVGRAEVNTELKQFKSGNHLWYQAVASTTVQVGNNMRVTNAVAMCTYDDNNGKCQVGYTEGADGLRVVQETEFAYERFPGMAAGSGTGQILAASGMRVYQAPSRDDELCQMAPSVVHSATFTTWSQLGPGNGYRPDKTYVWVHENDANGAPPAGSFHAFSLSSPTANGWQLTRNITRYNQEGKILEVYDGAEVPSAIIYRSDFGVPMAKVSNGRYDECASFTCDYEVADPAHTDYFDYANGWQKAGAVLSSTKTHLGEQSVYIDLPVGSQKFGPSRNIRIYPGTDYVMSAWVLVESGQLLMDGDYRHLQSTTIPHQVSGTMKEFEGKSVSAGPEWQRMELLIPANTDLSASDWDEHDWCVRVFVGNPNGVKAYIDDIRFHPASALMSTTYYESTYRLPRLSVGPDGNPGKLAEYDEFGRAVSSSVIDVTKSAQDDDYAQLLAENEYRTAGDGLRLLTQNRGTKVYRGGSCRGEDEYYFYSRETTVIRWWAPDGVVGQNGVDVEFFDGASWRKLAENLHARGAYPWRPAPDHERPECKIRVVAHDDPTIIDESDVPFAVVSNRLIGGPDVPSGGSTTLEPGDPVVLTWRPESDPEGEPQRYAVYVVSDTDHDLVARDLLVPSYELGVPTGDVRVRWQVYVSDGRGCERSPIGEQTYYVR